MTRKAPLPAFAQKIVGETNEEFLLRTRKPFKPYHMPATSMESRMRAEANKAGRDAYTSGASNPYRAQFMREEWQAGFDAAKAKQHNERAGLL